MGIERMDITCSQELEKELPSENTSNHMDLDDLDLPPVYQASYLPFESTSSPRAVYNEEPPPSPGLPPPAPIQVENNPFLGSITYRRRASQTQSDKDDEEEGFLEEGNNERCDTVKDLAEIMNESFKANVSGSKKGIKSGKAKKRKADATPKPINHTNRKVSN
jgi:hypothetical protein